MPHEEWDLRTDAGRRAAREAGLPVPGTCEDAPGPTIPPAGDPVAAFVMGCLAHGLPAPVAEYRFHHMRKWRFDWAFPGQKIALEIQGGNWKGGRHTRAAALQKEYEKLNAAAVAGWRILYCTPADVESGAVYQLIKAALEAKL